MKLKHFPKGDARNRRFFSKSVRLWVVYRQAKKSNIDHFGIMHSIQRSVYRIEGREGEFVQYDTYFHPLHTAEEFSEYLELGVKGKIHFFSNEAGISGKTKELRTIAPAPFIFDDERGMSAL